MAERSSANTRADQVRARRSTQSSQRATQAKQRIRYASEAPQVIVRGNIGTPVARRASTHPRRKIAIPLGQPGAELHMPALPMVNPGWKLLSALITIAMLALISLMYNLPVLQVGIPEVEGVSRISPLDVAAALNLQGLPVFTIDPQAVQQQVEQAFVDLKDVKVSVAFPNQVRITAVERQPIIRWHAEGLEYWSDNEGVLLPVRGDMENLLLIEVSGALPVVKAEPVADEEQTPEMAAIQALNPAQARQVQPEATEAAIKLRTYLPAEVTSLAYSEADGIGWTDPRGWQVFIGNNLENLDEKMAVYEAIVSQLQDQGVTPAMISVEFIHAPFYRLEQ
ncbi:MAG: FtsQ-type POTRA domain-containing protein [Chloroflexi bacterium]|nr:FtsQ-type POTRA domain-containing protein [Chloroflexota bacterium]